MHKSNITTVLFDMDGVLIDSVELWINVGLKGAQERNITSIQREDMIRAIVKFETLTKHGIHDLTVFGDRINTLFHDHISEISLQPGVVELLKSLHNENIKMAVITTSGRKSVDTILHNLGITDFFQSIIAFEDVTRHKPHPEGILKTLKKIGSNPADSIMIGDTRNDIVASKCAGVQSILYYPTHHEKIYDKDHLLALGADYYIKNLQEALEIIKLSEQ